MADLSFDHATSEYRFPDRYDAENFKQYPWRYWHVENVSNANADVRFAATHAEGYHLNYYLEWRRFSQSANQAVAETRLESVWAGAPHIDGSARFYIIVDICTTSTAPIPA